MSCVVREVGLRVRPAGLMRFTHAQLSENRSHIVNMFIIDCLSV